MHLPNVLLLWPWALLCLSGVLANQDSSKYELILYWRLRQYMVDAVGEEGNTVAKKCKSPCDFKAFMRTLSFPRKGPVLKKPDGTNRKDPLKPKKNLFQYYPDFTKDFTIFTDDLFSHPEAAAMELDNVHFTGRFISQSQFQGALDFDQIISNVENAIKTSQTALKGANRDPEGGWFKEIKNLLSIVANGRRYNRAIHLTQEFKDWLKENNLERVDVKMTDPIHRAPFVYQKVDFAATYADNQNVAGIQKWEEAITEFAEKQNKNGPPLGHVKCIRAIENLQRSLEAGCTSST